MIGINLTYSVKAPCQECKERELGCHEWCKRYKEFKEEVERYKEKDRKNQQARNDAIEIGKLRKEQNRKRYSR